MLRCRCRAHSYVCAQQYSHLSRHILCVQLTTESALETECWLNHGEGSSLPSVSETVCRRQYVADLIIQNVRQLIIQGFSRHIFKAASSVTDISSLIFLLFKKHTFKTISSFGQIYQWLYRKMTSVMMVVEISVNLKLNSFFRRTPASRR